MKQHLKFHPLNLQKFAFPLSYVLQCELLTLHSAVGRQVLFTSRPINRTGSFKTAALEEIEISVLDGNKFWLKLRVAGLTAEFYYFVSWNEEEGGWDYSESYFFEQVPEYRIFIRNILRIGKEYRLLQFGIL
jgi:hypothetical protein